MSVRIMSEVWQLDLPHEQQSVLLALADHAHDDGSKCFPGVRYLAWKTGYDRRSIQRILRALEASEVIVAVAYATGGRGHSAEYVIETGKGVRKSPFLREQRAAPVTERAASGTQRAAPTPPQPSVTINEPGTKPTVRRARLKDEYGEDARLGVAAYYEARRAVGLNVDRRECGKLASHLMAARKRGWSREMCLEAVRQFAASKRATVFFGEWVATVFNAETWGEYEKRRAEPFDADAFRALLRAVA